MGGGMMKDVSTPPHTQHLYPYRWSLEDAVFTKDKGKVFSCFACGGGSTMAKYIEYKNKTQEKCNYCTIYQCISGFYKKNVELHLLLILAIDSVIYSFYVTILLCKKAPVFD